MNICLSSLKVISKPPYISPLPHYSLNQSFPELSLSHLYLNDMRSFKMQLLRTLSRF